MTQTTAETTSLDSTPSLRVRSRARHASPRYIPELDGLRGMAIVMVMTGHFWLGAHPVGFAQETLFSLIQNGWVGVDLFLVLSGFLVTGILLDSKGEQGYFRNFYARRVLRIFPLYYAFLFFWFFVFPRVVNLSPNGPFTWGKNTEIWYWTYTMNWLSLVKGARLPLGLNHFWTLAVEEQFYLIWPAVVVLTSSRTLRRLCVTLIPLEIVFRLWLRTTPYGWTGGVVLTPARMGTLAVGAWLASAVREPALRSKVERAAPWVLFTSLALLVALNPDLRMEGYEVQMQSIGFNLLAFIGGSGLVMCMRAGREALWYRKVFRSGVLRFFGKYSYAMYVFHLPVIVIFAGLDISIASISHRLTSDVLSSVVFSAICLLVTTVLAFASWHLYEKQFMKIKDRFRYRYTIPAGEFGDQSEPGL